MKTAIIGGGTIGLYLAWKLSEKGERVCVFEKKRKSGKEVCSGLFSERILTFIPESRGLIQNEIDSCLIHFPKKTLYLSFCKKFFVVNHIELDQLLTDSAQKAGAKISFGKKIDKRQIEEIKTGFEKIIGSDGANSVLRNYLGLPCPEIFLGLQYLLKEKDYSRTVQTWATDKGFCWKIPRGEAVEYGIMEKPKTARKIFFEFLKKEKIHPQEKEIRAALIPQGPVLPRKNQKITLCGDAAGLTKPWSGGGVIWGLKAADLLLKSFPDFLKYEKDFKKYFLPKFIFSKLIKNSVYFFGFRFPGLIPKKYKVENDFLI